jgi:hypothetical protein
VFFLVFLAGMVGTATTNLCPNIVLMLPHLRLSLLCIDLED